MPDNEWTSWIRELQNLSQCALAYCQNWQLIFDSSIR
ncbi:MAG: NUDIX hydrolase N-terminal domain-containing protein [Clostridia bacterium]|nr:NUDIX hydrolase N-terminal domain-containing protein [Clostridia bacterium]MBR6889397.1 NUDIX hydrolase N-terminal domain-containing protein [Clostridia bacterium]